MFILKINLAQWLGRMKSALKLSFLTISKLSFINISRINLIEQIVVVGPESLGISIITACFIGMVFTLQVVKEFLYLDATSVIGAILSLAFIRELSPVLTAIIIAGRIGSSFTAEIATMQVTEQIDALYLLKTDPVIYLVMPRLIACLTMLPILNLIFFFTSLSSSIFTCFIFYDIHPWIFLKSVFLAISYLDIFKSILKTIVFGFILSNISCSWGLNTVGGSKSVGQSTTSSVVTSLLMIFIIDFILSYFMFNQTDSAIKSL
uniref:ABC transporter permease n=1 Tax=Corallina officinalis TaxID=35170 RepID=A0A6M3WAM1_COROI|nr:hypothetical protein [Corallina officinalis]QJF58487.1 hypothetical protein [Corallina officinalis]QJF58686.1 hypothetical protein [Corallina officinalis]QJF58885.1 hypothetical protein [Corallina officinalis]